MNAKARLAVDQASVLMARFGVEGAERVAREKISDAPHLVNGDAPFWQAVLRSIVEYARASR